MCGCGSIDSIVLPLPSAGRALFFPPSSLCFVLPFFVVPVALSHGLSGLSAFERQRSSPAVCFHLVLSINPLPPFWLSLAL
jgi:hypothetical protein